MVVSHTLGFPRVGKNRELKKALESFWAGRSDGASLHATAADLRRRHWKLQREAGIDLVPSNDFSLYDHVLDACALFGAVPARYGSRGGRVDLATYFAMARGTPGDGIAAMEMTKWFDTNYHYIVPEFSSRQEFRISSTKPFDEFEEAKALGIATKPVLLGPVSFLLLGKGLSPGVERRAALERLLPCYADVLTRLGSAGAEWAQLDEPCAVLDLPDEDRALFAAAYAGLAGARKAPRLLLATYFEGLRDNAGAVASLPVAALHLDLCRAPGQLGEVLPHLSPGTILSLGVIDGRNVWRADLEKALALLEEARGEVGADRVWVAPSCSLLHVPVDLDDEIGLDGELRSWLAFAKQKLAEVAALRRALAEGRAAAADAFEASARARESRGKSPRIHNLAVADRLAKVGDADARRRHPFAERTKAQAQRLGLPTFPTTTIGSFPQTPEVRSWRARWKKGELTTTQYEGLIEGEIRRTIEWQEQAGLDLLVHGEFERNDMVEYFGEQLAGFAFTQNGWVQSYGSRCVKPPILYGDVARPAPMTVRWSRFAQSAAKRPVKGMLTGPVTILQWSFVRDDQPRSRSAFQLALALRDEVADLERAGIPAIQVDEPAIREGLPLRRADRPAYLEWAVRAFRLATSGVADATQIHTHMCYSEFNEILEAIAAMDADVISVEASRSRMELLQGFERFRYPNEIGPGVYDIHSPRVPATEEIVSLLESAAKVLDPRQIWVNPDCGLKTRTWEEVKPALANLVAAAKKMRAAAPAG
ncbi:MAG: 5-methyltetrahydropteroyltriglutamate--homocysteine S-methyltransferase [Planctomycetes bacterium]|nr:5-methyltetrahydropteroyltriglutamate--homocysteine S-methyltransferase [Planctomycetota bacterium]